MKVFRDHRDGGMPRGMVTGVGIFDGVHLGHQVVIREVLRQAGDRGVVPGLLTFHPHPASVVGAGLPPPLIYTPDENRAILEAFGVEVLVEQEFDLAFSRLSADDFIREVLAGSLRPAGVVVGHDFRFGAGGAGDVALLSRAGARHGFTVTAVGEVLVDGLPVRSSLIRECISAGDLARAARLLGRPWHLAGRVMAGVGVGRDLGFPTANLLPPGKIVPPDGVYAGEAAVEGKVFPAAVNIGSPGNRAGGPRLVEAHLLGFDGDLYGRDLEIRFRARLREERRFPDHAALAAQIARDVARVGELAKEGWPS